MFHHHHSPAMRLVGKISWLLTAVAAVCWGLVGLGSYLGRNLNLWDFEFFRNMPHIVSILQVLIGLAGLLSLITLFSGCCSEEHHGKR
jgi:uncharacterized membrane protein YuzA (DUF378 family)